MPSNDTENIYSTQFNEGEAQPIPATRIGYDNDASGLNATNVQEAIDEIADVKNNFVFVDLKTVAVTADGVKTNEQMLNELYTLFMTTIQNLAADEAVKVTQINIEGFYTLTAQTTNYYNKTATSVSLAFQRAVVNVASDKLTFANVNFSTTPYMAEGIIAPTPTVGIFNRITDVYTAGRRFTITYELFKKV